MTWLRRILSACIVLGIANFAVAQSADKKKDEVPETISYYKDVRPIVQQHCQGCHQPAMAKGGFVMTGYADLFKKTDNLLAGVVPGNLKNSELYQQIIPQEGKKPAMPKGKDSLSDREVTILRKWIEQGAKDDTPASAKLPAVDAVLVAL
ncbi:MAG: hypothetical protein HYR84_07100, partial [Planctomycetes bacterium]|nr:hypothetical protein [Planctomycetota bacterium]